MKLNNQQIYLLAQIFVQLSNNTETYVPAKTSFYIQKNTAILSAAAQGIEEARLSVAQHYGELDADKGIYTFPPETTEAVQQELAELFSVDQELSLYTFTLEDLEPFNFSPAEMQIFMLLIEE